MKTIFLDIFEMGIITFCEMGRFRPSRIALLKQALYIRILLSFERAF